LIYEKEVETCRRPSFYKITFSIFAAHKLWAKSLFNKTKILRVRLTACDISVEERVMIFCKILLLLCAPYEERFHDHLPWESLGPYVGIIIYIDPLLKSLVAYINI
jgi:hypothetical protein